MATSPTTPPSPRTGTGAFATAICCASCSRPWSGALAADDASIIRADASRHRGVDGAAGLPPEAASRAVQEYLEVLDEAAFGAATDVTPKYLAPADPASRWTAAQAGPASFAYCTNYLIDLEHAVIVDVEPSTAVRQGELAAFRTMVERTGERLNLHPRLANQAREHAIRAGPDVARNDE